MTWEKREREEEDGNVIDVTLLFDQTRVSIIEEMPLCVTN